MAKKRVSRVCSIRLKKKKKPEITPPLSDPAARWYRVGGILIRSALNCSVEEPEDSRANNAQSNSMSVLTFFQHL